MLRIKGGGEARCSAGRHGKWIVNFFTVDQPSQQLTTTKGFEQDRKRSRLREIRSWPSQHHQGGRRLRRRASPSGGRPPLEALPVPAQIPPQQVEPPRHKGHDERSLDSTGFATPWPPRFHNSCSRANRFPANQSGRNLKAVDQRPKAILVLLVSWWLTEPDAEVPGANSKQ